MRRERGCGPQYQSATVRVLTHFTAEPAERGGPADFLLGSDWQVDVTELVRESLRVLDARVARLQQGTVLMGMDTGTTKVQVRGGEEKRGTVGGKELGYSVCVSRSDALAPSAVFSGRMQGRPGDISAAAHTNSP